MHFPSPTCYLSALPPLFHHLGKLKDGRLMLKHYSKRFAKPTAMMSQFPSVF